MAVTETSQAASRTLDDLYREHGPAVYRYALAVLGNRADAEDVTQTTFLNAYRSLEQGVRPRKPANWLLTIASNTIKQRFRQELSRPHHVELDEQVAGSIPDDDGPTVGEVLTALSKIPPQQRQAIVLREFEGRSYGEIAEILGVTTSALETLLFRARRSLAEELEHHLTCTEAQLAISRAADGRLGRKERRRLREHLEECPDCASFARLQQRHRGALKTLLLVPAPLSLSLFKGFEGTASAATLPAAGVGAAAATTGVGAVAATTGVGAAGVGAGGAGGGLLAGGVALKAAAVVTAATVATGGVVGGASELTAKAGKKAQSPALVKPGKSASAPGRSVSNGKAVGKSTAPGQARASGAAAPGQVRKQGTPAASRGNGQSSAGKPVVKVKPSGRVIPVRPTKPKPAKPVKPTKQAKPPKADKPAASKSPPGQAAKSGQSSGNGNGRGNGNGTPEATDGPPADTPGTGSGGNGHGNGNGNDK
jgi:RNA polymerase sigma factor (sigma-70 family)